MDAADESSRVARKGAGVPDYSEYAVFREWVVWLLAACSSVLAVAALVLALARSTVTGIAGGLAIVLALATIGAGLLLTHERRADCDRDERNRTWSMHGQHVWHDERCPTEALGSTVLSLELAALPLLLAPGALWRARRTKGG